jgi:hypothetical protein
MWKDFETKRKEGLERREREKEKEHEGKGEGNEERNL